MQPLTYLSTVATLIKSIVVLFLLYRTSLYDELGICIYILLYVQLLFLKYISALLLSLLVLFSPLYFSPHSSPLHPLIFTFTFIFTLTLILILTFTRLLYYLLFTCRPSHV